MMWQRPDSLPFREPVDTIEFPDYLEIIATPMDLRTVKEDLLGGNYDDPLDFAKDVRLIFLNSKNYNTNKRSRVSLSLPRSTATAVQIVIYSKPMPNTLHLRCHLSLQICNILVLFLLLSFFLKFSVFCWEEVLEMTDNTENYLYSNFIIRNTI